MQELTWRPLTAEDAQSSADLLNAIETVDKIGENYTAEDTLTEIVDPYADMERGSLAAFDGDAMVGYMKVQYKPSAEEVHRVFLDGGVHPAYRRRGIGTTLVRAGIEAAKVLHELHHPTLKLAIDVNKAEHIAGVAELLGAHGFAPGRYYQRMEHPLRELRPVAFPAGLRVEPWSEQNDEDFRATRNASFAGVAVPMPSDLWRNKITNQTFRPGLSFLVRDGDKPVSLLVTMSWDADTEATGIRDAHFMVIGTVPEYRGRGACSALLAHALLAAKEQGYDQASLRVESASAVGAPEVFVRTGFVPDIRYVRWALDV
ncbi:GNAT family N-acetyltransferase [Lentzea kentuckyensis]|uniref:GNAT family N-acetyltransferase n=1 Tax=Lentzea kentuckyensis TaxID=360086 RepID=UPI000A38A6C7|nr:GNAT family N-acetyltransferase [Lentzea kentuckyensis]